MNGKKSGLHEIKIGDQPVGDGHPIFITAEIGINHNGDLGIAKRLIDAAWTAGCDAVKFQKRNPAKCVPKAQQDVLRDTPWGRMRNIEFRERLEFGFDSYKEIDYYCRSKPILWFVSCWDEDSVEFMSELRPPCYKVPSACLTNDRLLNAVRRELQPIVVSTGMSTLAQVTHAVEFVGTDDIILLQCTSDYPAKPEELNLRVLSTYRERFQCLVGYSGHEVGISTTFAAAALGACYIERHITLDRTMWGSDHAASIEPEDFACLVRGIRAIEMAMGDGEKRVYESERRAMIRLRGAV